MHVVALPSHPSSVPGQCCPRSWARATSLFLFVLFFFFPCLGQHCSCFALEVGSELGEVCWTAGLVVILIQVAPTEASPL